MQNCLEARGVLHIKRLSRDLSENFLSHLLPNLLRTDHEPNSAPPPSLPLHLHFLPPFSSPSPPTGDTTSVLGSRCSLAAARFADQSGGRPGRTGRDVLRRLDAAVRQLLHQEVREPRADPMSVSWSILSRKRIDLARLCETSGFFPSFFPFCHLVFDAIGRCLCREGVLQEGVQRGRRHLGRM